MTKTRSILLATILGANFFGVLNASAVTYQTNVPIQFTINPVLSINLSSSDLAISDLAPGSSGDSNIITVGVSTNALYGYTLSATVGTKTGASTALTNTTNSTYRFNNLSSTASSLANIPDNNWGYSYSSDNGATWVSGNTGSTTTGYAGLPLDNNDNADERGKGGVLLIDNDGTSNINSVKFKIGAKASSTQPSGEYTNVINFYAVTNPEPKNYMQNISTSTLSELMPNIGDTSILYDSRDEQAYTIGKLADSNYWLLDNLALDLTNSTVLNGMNESNTNASNTTLGYLKNGGGTTSDKYATSAVSSWVSGYSYSDPLVNMANKDVVPQGDDPMASDALAGNWKVGGHYNYCAASAGSYCYGNGTSAGTSSGNATEDICPAGWRMPSGASPSEYNILYTNSNYNTYANYRSALHLPLSGDSNNGSPGNQGSSGFWWSSTRYGNSDMYGLYANTSNISPVNNGGRLYGLSVRCVLGS